MKRHLDNVQYCWYNDLFDLMITGLITIQCKMSDGHQICNKISPSYLFILSGDQKLNNFIQLQSKYSAENA